jgi:transposase-like protein
MSTFKLSEVFPDEPSARKYFESRRWKDGVICPECKSKERITTRKDGYYRCNACKLDFTVRTGTIFERSHVPLHKWLYAIYLLATARKSITSLQLSKEIGITQKSAWFVRHRLREAFNPHTARFDKLQTSANALDAIADVADIALAYHPKPKTKAAKRRIRRNKGKTSSGMG